VDEPYEDGYDSEHQKDIDESAERIAGNDAQKPQHQ
jgi:hypothetical protein